MLSFLRVPALLVLAASPGQQALEPPVRQRQAAQRVNFVVVVLDDVGIDQLSAYDAQNHYTDPGGYPYAHTPTIDALAACGVRFEQARAMPKCSPTRAAMLTGQYPFVTGQGEIAAAVFRGQDFDEANVPPAPTLPPLPFLLRAAGYATVAIGKWHLALDPELGGTMDEHPREAFAFDEWRGTPRNLAGPDAPPGGGYYLFEWSEDGARTTVQGEYATTYTVDRAVDWIATAPQPFFAWVAFNGCHLPLDAANWPPAGLHGFGPTPAGGTNTGFRACLEALDAELARLLAGIPPDRRANTLLVVVGDNGTENDVLVLDPSDARYPAGHPLHRAGDEAAGYSTAPYDPLRAKETVYEAGVRVPLIVASHPDACAPDGVVLLPGRTHAGPVDVTDLFATLLELADLPGAGGVSSHSYSFVGALRSPAWAGPRAWSLGQRHEPNGQLLPHEEDELGYLRVDGANAWKLVRRQSGGNPYEWEFYDLVADPLETTDLGTAHPEYLPTRVAMQTLLVSGP